MAQHAHPGEGLHKANLQIDQNLRQEIGNRSSQIDRFKICIWIMIQNPKVAACVFVVLDHFSKYTFIKAMKKATVRNVIQFLTHEVFHKFVVPEIIHTDKGMQFT